MGDLTVKSGCYIYGTADEMRDPTNKHREGAQSIDIAILRPNVDKPGLRTKLGSAALKVDIITPLRGSSVLMVNNQLNHTPDNPAVYPAVVAENSSTQYGVQVITGIQPGPEGETNMKPGGSGGMLVDSRGRLVATSQAVLPSWAAQPIIRHSKINIAPSPGQELTIATVTPAQAINDALLSGRY